MRPPSATHPRPPRPGSQIHQRRCNIRPDPRHRDAALHTGRIDEVDGRDVHILLHDAQSVRLGHVCVKGVSSDRNEGWMGNLSSIMPGTSFLLLISLHFIYCSIIRRGIALGRDLCGHASHGDISPIDVE
jgi:hypothetical protein